jgi:phosphotriesterase-related protein
MFVESKENTEIGYQPVKIENLDWLKRHTINSIDNLKQLDKEVAINELNHYKKLGGKTIVDMGNIGLNRDPKGLAHISKRTDLHIVMGSGYYVGGSHPPELADKSVSDIALEIVEDITEGVNGTGVKAGVIGEIGCSHPLQETEKKVLKAVAKAQQKTGAPVNIHPGRSQQSPIEITKMFHGLGGDIKHTAISHLSNRHGLDIGLTIELAETGCYIEYDSFGNYQNPINLPEKTFYALSDWQRIKCIKTLIKQGFLDKLLISHDIFNKTDLRQYGGFGYDHIHATVIPMMNKLGVTDKEIHIMLVENPRKFFQFQ